MDPYHTKGSMFVGTGAPGSATTQITDPH